MHIAIIAFKMCKISFSILPLISQDEEGNEILKATLGTFEDEFKDGSKSKQVWRDHWVDFIKVPKSFFDLPKHCRKLH